ncbi:hypothetical protein GUITHDRAFT_144441 [Guillardia theta CCMP2712]|uniref:C2 NT-type domain-containing protein n=1 Tax=Guillardia theta (strain CCMP2712) TaxID=905079 RepID=L1IQG7_GUITC|nr:hypothetical protein GUITHDRAFT_144441 [Guillardia theta CCMP2712]EKX38129.1 hypothetical protein GUITHDRAFT_144441 [Guillardia theta CCMP2712]|eukprot:XP_005825109.1 hypothetical protein GUITHDRAFT_144441 [Guillardia theta CCMP2712]
MKKLMQLRARANGNKFIFTIVIRTDFEASVSIHRGSNLVETKIQPIMNKKITWNETFEILCTLYRTKEGDFQEKIAKIQLRGSHESYSTEQFDLTKAASTTFEGKEQEPSFPGLRGTTRYKATTGNSVSRDSLEIEEEETNSPFTPDESAIEVVQNLREPVKVLLNPREMRELKKSETLHEADEAIAKTKMHHHYEEIDHLKGMIEKCKAEIYHRDKIIQGLQLSEYNLRLQVASLNSRMSETARQENGASETNLSHDIQEAIASETERLTLAYLPVIRDLMKELEDTRFHQQYR